MSTAPRSSAPAPGTTRKKFRPPELPEAAKLREAREKLKRMSREELLEITVEVGIHNPDGTLKERHVTSGKSPRK
jgi:hypothetical protein